ncbi:MAG: m5C1962 methyltransferase RlmI [Labilithrix sp.]|nr:m5C1962 methyltransferase RlmI [Labilithrix sp.]
MATVRLKPGHVQPVWAGHPWVYAQAIDRVEGGATRGDEVSVVDPRGNLLGRGLYSPGSAIPVRLLVRDADTPIDTSLFRHKFERALALRQSLGIGTTPETTGYRLVHAEGDGLPGLIVDRFGDVLVVQLLTVGMKDREAMIFEALGQVFHPRAIIDRTPPGAAKAEGFVEGKGVVRGEDPHGITFTERGVQWSLSSDVGQKTGFYFDQRDLRGRVESLARGKRVLDAYSYVGAFGIAAARGGAAEVICVDESAAAIETGAEQARLNGVEKVVSYQRADARRVLADAKGTFDLTIVDPPRLAPTRGAREQALVMYAKLAELGCRATRPDGLLVLCSCSSAVDLFALTRALATGAVRANVHATVVERSFQGADHPVPAAFAEGLYLKAIVARVETR